MEANMSDEIVQFRMTKFTSALQELQKNQNHGPLIKHFEDIKLVLEKKTSPDVPDQTRDTLLDCLYKLDDTFGECHKLSENRRKQALASFYVRKLYFHPKIKRRLSKIKQSLGKVMDASTSGSPSTGGILTGQKGSLVSGIYGFDNRVEDIVTSLQQDSDGGINTVGVVGMGGSGKTTLAHLVFNHPSVTKVFIPRIWVSLPNKIDSKSDFTKAVVEFLLKDLGGEGADSDDGDDEDDDDDDDEDDDEDDDDEKEKAETEKANDVKGGGEEEDKEVPIEDTSLDNLLITLHKKLSGKKYLIVFDDVWHINSWYKNLVKSELSDKEQCGEPRGIPKGSGGGIMLTSRLEEVKEFVGETNFHLLPMLDGDNCWSIFMEVMNEGASLDHQRLANMKNEIIDNCNGLPLAAKTLGMIMSEKMNQ